MDRTALDYQQHTCYQRHQMDPHGLDWPNQPSPYKHYADVPKVELPLAENLPAKDFPLVAGSPPSPSTGLELDMALLTQVLSLGYSLTAQSRHGGQAFYYRSVASAGALYPTELYLAAAAVDGLAAGLYHYEIGQRCLGLLRPGVSQNHIGALWGDLPGKNWQALFWVTGRFFRSAWKYRTRGYRYVLLDAGHLLGGLGLALNAVGLPWEVHFDFDDRAVARFLGLDLDYEGALACIGIPSTAPLRTSAAARNGGPQQAIVPEAAPLCREERVDPAIKAIHGAGLKISLEMPSNFNMADHMGFAVSSGPAITTGELPGNVLAFAETVLKRRSKRNFIRGPLNTPQLNFMGSLMAAHYAGEAMGALYRPRLLSLGLLTGDGAGVPPGYYLLGEPDTGLSLVKSGSLTAPMAAACLNQEWLAQAALHYVLTADLAAIDRLGGVRGYRRAMIQAGSLGQVIYLAATAIGLGACGIGAYYDHEARDLLGLGEHQYMLYLIAAGPVKK